MNDVISSSSKAETKDPRYSCSGKRVGILILAYNAVSTLVKVLKRIPEEVWNNVEEVVVFDDASHDHTYELAMGYKVLSKQARLSILRNDQNLGYGGNQKKGYRYFMDRGFDVVVLLHGDGQYAPEMLAEMYAHIVSGEADAVFGSRMMNKYGGPLKGGMPFYKYLGNKILTFIENRALGMNLTEFHSGYRAYSVAALRNIQFKYMTDDFHFDTEIIIKLNHQGYRIKEVPIPTYYGDEICYVNGLRYAYNVIRSVIRYKLTVACARSYPEYEEYYRQYPLKPSIGSSHSIVRDLIGTGRKVLDIGCGEGFFAEYIRQGNDIVGVDKIPAPAKRQAFTRYIEADLEQGLPESIKAPDGQKFDVILFMDVLEHLAKPEALLTGAAAHLKSNGMVIVSLPNVANITVRIALMFGRWRYRDKGILDRSHLRFYTRRTGLEMIESCGLRVVQRYVTSMPVEAVLGLSGNNRIVRVLTMFLGTVTKLLPGVLGYQNIYVAVPVVAQK